MDKSEFLIKASEINQKQSLHYQTQRTTVSGLLFSLSALVYGFIAFDKSLDSADIPILIFHAMISIFGVLFSAKYHQKYAIYHEIYRKLAISVFEEPFKSIRKKARDEHKMGFLNFFKIWHIWVGVHFSLVILSISLIVFILIDYA